MPANLPGEAKAAWNKVMSAKSPEEKIEALQEFLSLVPRHKGTSKLRAHVKSRIAALKAELEEKRRRKRLVAGHRTIEKAGAAQIMVIGPTNVGRSSLLSRLTNARPTIAPYGFTTQVPLPGMLKFEDIRFQLVEVPAMIPSDEGGLSLSAGTVDMVRGADSLILMVDLSSDPCGQLQAILDELDRIRITVKRPGSGIEVSRASGGGMQVLVSGELVGCSLNDVKQLLHSYGLKNAIIKVNGKVTLDDIEEAVLENIAVYKPAVVVANKLDLPEAKNNLLALEEVMKGFLPLIAVSCATGEGLDQLGPTLFRVLEIIRVYTKEPGEDTPSEQPFILRRGATTGELAKTIHTQLFENYKYARVWGPSAKFQGERAGLDHILQDGDIVEIHA